MTMTLAERLVRSVSSRTAPAKLRPQKFTARKSMSRESAPQESPRHGPTRRGLFGGAALVGAALAVNPWGYLVRPATAYESVCGTEPGCSDGYSVFCCTINGGSNTCPPNSFIGGWWKADNSSFCGGSARYYIDCNAYLGGPWQCRCASGTCDQRRVACNQFRYGQCSLEVPASQSGPVVCRMVSCTPPWQQFAGTCTSSSRTDNRTATHAAPCLVGRPPIGSLDAATKSGNAIRLTGWAFDPDQSSTALKIGVYVDGGFAGSFGTGLARGDVNRSFGISGNHGFDVTIPVARGTHAVKVLAIDIGPAGQGNPLIGSSVVIVDSLPRGHLDLLAAVPGNKVRVRGWAYDPDQPTTAIAVALHLDGKPIGWFPTGKARPDVNSVFGISGNHGFDVTINSPSGKHTVQVYAQNVGGGKEVPVIGTGQVSIGQPVGHFDAVTASGRIVRVKGWAYDPDQPSTALQVEVRWNGQSLGRFGAGLPRPDVNSVLGVPGKHGFDIEIGCPPGRNTFEVLAINIGPAVANPSLGSRTVQVL